MSAASAALASEDPSGTTSIREKARREFRSRWRDVRGEIRQELEDNPRLRPTSDRPTSRQTSEFRAFLERTIEDTVTEPLTTTSVLAGHHFTSSFVDEAFHMGLVLGNAHLRRAGVDVDTLSYNDAERLSRQGYYNEQLTQEYEGFYEDIIDGGQDAHTDVSRTYRELILGGLGVQSLLTGRTETQDGLNDRVTKAGLRSSERTVDYRTVRTANEAALLRYQDAGVDEVGALIELDVSVTSEEGQSERVAVQDDRTCQQCMTLAGNVYSISEIMQGSAPLPARDTHPGCRCFYEPIV